MADENQNIQFTLNLDTKEFVDGVLHAKGTILELGNAENLEGLLRGLTEAGVVLGTVGVAVLALKTAFDMTLEAETIDRVNKQFVMLGKNAGVVTATMKEQLVAATGGMAAETEVLQAANKAFIELGASAAKLPQIMQLAKQYTAAFGGDLVQNFENLNRAIASGNQRMLKQMGIVVDINKAHEAYAKSIGVAVNNLSDEDKRQATLNAVLDKGSKSLKGITADSKSATVQWQQMKVAVKEFWEQLSIAVGDSTAGSLVRRLTEDVKMLSQSWTTWLKASTGKGLDGAQAQVTILKGKLGELRAELNKFEKARSVAHDEKAVEGYTFRIEKLKAKMKEYQAQLDQATGNVKKFEAEQDKATEKQKKEAAEKNTGKGRGDQEKIKASQAKFEADLARLREERVQSEIKANQTIIQYDQLAAQQRDDIAIKSAANIKKLQTDRDLTEQQKNQLIEQEQANLSIKLMDHDRQVLENKKKMIQQEMQLTSDMDRYEALSSQQDLMFKEEHNARSLMLDRQFDEQKTQIENQKNLTDDQRKQMLDQLESQRKQAHLQEEQTYQDQLLQIQIQAEAQKEALLQRWVANSDNAAESFAKGFASASIRAQRDLSNFGAQGAKVAGIFQSHMVNAFMQVGEGSKKGSEIVKEAAFGMIADIAQEYGAMLLLTSIWPPNPVGLAAGAGLLVLSGYLRSQSNKAGGGFSGGTSTSGSVSGMGDLGGAPSALGNTSLAQDTQKQAKSVHLEVHGDLIETEAAQRHITEMVRNAMDATDFSIQKVGGGI
jgi:hypothetical protein